MNALALALLVAAGPLYEEESYAGREFRAGGGGTVFLDVDGIAPTAELGLDLAPWDRLGLRFTFGTALRVGWGSVFFSPELVYRPRPAATVSPYLTGGVQGAVLNLSKRARGLPDVAAGRAAAVGDGEPIDDDGGSAGGGPVPLRFSAGPQAGAGLSLHVLGTTLDVGVRYTLHFFDGETYSGIGLLLSVIGPVRF